MRMTTHVDAAVALLVAGYALSLLAVMIFFVIPGIGLIFLFPALALIAGAFAVRRHRYGSPG